ncbi:MAG: OsmC family protein [Candidatus Eisenbacteria bacterium]
MLEVKAKWMGGFRFDGEDSEGRAMKMDASKEGGGTGGGFRPAELPLMGLAGCTGIDTVEILKKMRQEVTAFSLTVSSKKKEGYPAGYDGIHVAYEVHGKGLDEEKVEKAVRLSEEKYCTVGQALSKATTITHTITIIED